MKVFSLDALALPLLLLLVACSSKKSDPQPTAPLPALVSFAPATGAAGGSVTLTGLNLTGATSVTFNGVAATSFTVSSGTSVTVTVPTGATTGPISITTPGGTALSTTPFTVTSGALTVPCTAINTSTTWPDRLPGTAVDYIITCPITITGSAVLTIAPGVRIQFTAIDASLVASANSGLKAVGTATEPIVFQGTGPSSWRGILFGSNNPLNQLEYVTISQAGGSAPNTTNKKGAVQITSTSSRASISNTTIQQTDGYGIYVVDRATLAGFGSNTFAENAEPMASVPVSVVGVFDAATNYGTTNAKPWIEVRGTAGTSFIIQLETAATLTKLPVPYRFSGTNYLKATLTIQPGTVLEFETGASLTTLGNLFETTGALNAVGTAANHIVFRGVQRAKGAWKGIAFCTPNPSNNLIYCDVSDGGSDAIWGPSAPAGLKANVLVGSSSRAVQATIRNCVISNSLGYGLAQRNLPAVTLTQSANSFATNATGDQTTW